MTTTTRPVADAPAVAVLEHYREVFAPAMRAAIGALPASTRAIANYHLGWSDADGRPQHSDGGKALRPALTLAAARAVGGEVSAALPAAVAVELVHNFSLLHDDVMDRDTTRRHRPTAWTVFGVGPAILTGDALVTAAFEVIAAGAHPQAADAARLLSRAVLDLVDGQCADLSFEQRADVTVAECVAMADGKTGALFGGGCALGGVLGDADSAAVQRLGEFGRLFGRAFQHTDDLLGIWGDAGVTGKPVYSDLRRRKKSLPVVCALQSGSTAGRALTALYHRSDPLTDEEVATAAALVEEAGGRAWSRSQAAQLYEQALATVAALTSDTGARAELELLAALAAGRSH